MSATDVIPEVLLSPGTWNSGDWLWLLNFRKLLLLEMFSYHNKPISMQLLSAFPVHFHARLVILAMQMRWLGYQNFPDSAGDGNAGSGHPDL